MVFCKLKTWGFLKGSRQGKWCLLASQSVLREARLHFFPLLSTEDFKIEPPITVTIHHWHPISLFKEQEQFNASQYAEDLIRNLECIHRLEKKKSPSRLPKTDKYERQKQMVLKLFCDGNSKRILFQETSKALKVPYQRVHRWAQNAKQGKIPQKKKSQYYCDGCFSSMLHSHFSGRNSFSFAQQPPKLWLVSQK